MNSVTHYGHRRLFARVAVVSTLLVLGLLSAEVLFPTAPAAPYESAPGTDFQRLLLVITVFVALASVAGAGIATVLAWMAKWKEREEDPDSALVGRFRLAAEPANERLRALRAVTLEESQFDSPDRS
ncbi:MULTISPECIES: hypothetical protein [unclassified Variovorax]|nr:MULTISPECIES: hypothetical protein [unclassified Variovorax]PNG49044.1 hypothetical protein CHC06_06281 [Variovorax sp. B2]PNG49429.1 hypothetical protein CHC07_06338 [Variovorax sp. B4]VTV18951.1 hypothetical protein WDL1P2_00559 [Variovorax sp. WDL1]